MKRQRADNTSQDSASDSKPKILVAGVSASAGVLKALVGVPGNPKSHETAGAVCDPPERLSSLVPSKHFGLVGVEERPELLKRHFIRYLSNLGKPV